MATAWLSAAENKGTGALYHDRVPVHAGAMNDTTPPAAPQPPSPSYPVAFDVEPQLTDRNRLTVAFRIILAIPHLILVGGPAFALGGSGWLFWRTGAGYRFGGGFGGGGVIGLVAVVVAVIAWFAIVFGGTHPRGLWDFTRMYMRWRTKAGAYIALFRDEYPPFGEGEYAVTYEVAYPEAARNRWSVGLRIFYLIPHAIVLFFLNIAWAVTSVIAWFAILFTGAYPDGLYKFGVGVMRWGMRVETYALLMRDEYPPFSLEQ